MTPTNYGAVNMQSLFLLGSLRHLDAVQPRTNMSSDGWLIDLFLPCSLECFLERQDDIMFLGPEGIVTFWRIYNEMILCVYILMFVCLSNYLLIFIYSYTHIYIYIYFFYTHIYTYSNGGTCSIATVFRPFFGFKQFLPHIFGISQLLSPCLRGDRGTGSINHRTYGFYAQGFRRSWSDAAKNMEEHGLKYWMF